MSAYELKPNKVNLFRNTRKQQESHADWQGTILIEKPGTYYINGWDNSGTNGPYISVTLKEKTERSDSTFHKAVPKNTVSYEDEDDSAPF